MLTGLLSHGLLLGWPSDTTQAHLPKGGASHSGLSSFESSSNRDNDPAT